MIYTNKIYEFLNEKYPYSNAFDYDNSGIIYNNNITIVKALISLDITENVIKEAIKEKANLLISHHPLSLKKIAGVDTNVVSGKLLALLIKNNINAISVHTNLDVAEKGVNNALADILLINKTKTFFDEKGAVLGKIGISDKKFLSELYELIKEKLGIEIIRAVECNSKINKVAVIGGAGSGFIYDAKVAGADTLVTSDCKHSSFLEAYALGINLIDAGHFHTENPALNELCNELNKKFKQISFTKAKANESIIKFI